MIESELSFAQILRRRNLIFIFPYIIFVLLLALSTELFLIGNIGWALLLFILGLLLATFVVMTWTRLKCPKCQNAFYGPVFTTKIKSISKCWYCGYAPIFEKRNSSEWILLIISLFAIIVIFFAVILLVERILPKRSIVSPGVLIACGEVKGIYGKRIL
jgi:hypothetical protein